MGRITSIYASDKIRSLARKSQGNFSGRLSNICDRFNEIMNDEDIFKKFTEYEKATLIHKFDGRVIEPAGLIRSLSKELSIGSQDLLEKIENLSYVDSVRLVEAIEKHLDEKVEE